jgi:maltose O-acetyltransferase
MAEDHFPDDPRTNWERMLAGDLYCADDPAFGPRLTRASQLADRYHREKMAGDVDDAQATLVELLGSVGEEVVIRSPLFVDLGNRISVGARTFVNCNLTALDIAPITIGADCQIGPSVQLLTPTHPIDPRQRRAKLEAAEPITRARRRVPVAGTHEGGRRRSRARRLLPHRRRRC